MTDSSLEPIYVNLASETEDPTVTQIESLCFNCQENGITKLLMTRIPHFREVIITSFECTHCGNRNTGVQSAATQQHGVCHELKVNSIKDLSRQVVTSQHASIHIPSLEFEIPANKEKGEVTNIEGVICRTVSNLEQNQPLRKHIQPEVADKIDVFITKLSQLLKVEKPFTIKIDDPSGNSFIENPFAPSIDPQLTKSIYDRSNQHNIDLGISTADQANSENNISTIEEKDEDEARLDDLHNEVLHFSSLCEKCSTPVQTNMKLTDVPNFKEVIIMATCCDNCGFRTNEVKSGSGICDLGRKITLKIKDVSVDMSRDVLKSDTCSVVIPELDIDVGAGILGGKFTTVEGLIVDIKDDLAKNSFLMGDSADADVRSKTSRLLAQIDEILAGKLNASLVLNDPAGNSYLQNVFAPEEDPQLNIEDYERDFEQNEDLGLNDMKTENYGEQILN